MRTRLLAATLTALATVGLAACSGSGSDTAAGTPSASPTAASSTTAPAGGSPTAAPTGPADATTPATTPAGTPGPTAEGSAPAKPAPPSDAGLPAKPNADLTAKVVTALEAIDPAIVGGKPEQAVDRARNQCQAMYQFPKDRAKLVELTQQRFTSPEHPQGFGPEKSEKILEALRATLCPAAPASR
ncbi:hypothetical protein ACWGB8_02225 [Kitasatospora sp. NPDC054939]